MKTIGLIGGMSWESTVSYYQIINEEVKRRLGGLHYAKVILYSVEFDEIEKCQSDGDWKKSGDILGKAAKSIEAAGADFILICTNTMHSDYTYSGRHRTRASGMSDSESGLVGHKIYDDTRFL